MRLLQVDWAVRDDKSDIGWVFGTYMYDGSQKNQNVSLVCAFFRVSPRLKPLENDVLIKTLAMGLYYSSWSDVGK